MKQLKILSLFPSFIPSHLLCLSCIFFSIVSLGGFWLMEQMIKILSDAHLSFNGKNAVIIVLQDSKIWQPHCFSLLYLFNLLSRFRRRALKTAFINSRSLLRRFNLSYMCLMLLCMPVFFNEQNNNIHYLINSVRIMHNALLSVCQEPKLHS